MGRKSKIEDPVLRAQVRQGLLYRHSLRRMAADFGVGHGTIDRIVVSIREEWAQAAENLPERFAEQLEHLSAVQSAAFAANDFSAAIRASDSIVKLLGLAAPDKLQTSGGVDLNLTVIRPARRPGVKIIPPTAPADDC